ncbi:ABC transporter permease, partial [Mesorhizobium sp. M2C.T.Ca.TU.009.01.2.1]
MSDRLRAVYGQLLAVLFALVIGAIIILMVDESPVKVFMTLLRGAFGDQAKIAGTLLQTTPILICGVAACIGLRGGMFNVGIEEQLALDADIEHATAQA